MQLLRLRSGHYPERQIQDSLTGVLLSWLKSGGTTTCMINESSLNTIGQ